MVRLIESNIKSLPFDPKGDPKLREVFLFHINGQVAYGEWFKQLGFKDKPPRGACRRFFVQHQHCRNESIPLGKMKRTEKHAHTRLMQRFRQNMIDEAWRLN